MWPWTSCPVLRLSLAPDPCVAPSLHWQRPAQAPCLSHITPPARLSRAWPVRPHAMPPCARCAPLRACGTAAAWSQPEHVYAVTHNTHAMACSAPQELPSQMSIMRSRQPARVSCKPGQPGGAHMRGHYTLLQLAGRLMQRRRTHILHILSSQRPGDWAPPSLSPSLLPMQYAVAPSLTRVQHTTDNTAQPCSSDVRTPVPHFDSGSTPKIIRKRKYRATRYFGAKNSTALTEPTLSDQCLALPCLQDKLLYMCMVHCCMLTARAACSLTTATSEGDLCPLTPRCHLPTMRICTLRHCLLPSLALLPVSWRW